jgi:hypothetical protein
LELRVLGKFSYAPIGKFFFHVFWQRELLAIWVVASWGCRLWHSPIKKSYFLKRQHHNYSFLNTDMAAGF